MAKTGGSQSWFHAFTEMNDLYQRINEQVHAQ